MAYNNSIPQPTDQLSQSQADILNNFIAIQTLIGVNHVNFNAGGQGKHNFIEMPVQNPVPVTGAGEVGLYCQTSALTGVPELVFSHQNAAGIAEFTSCLAAVAGWARLPSGILLKWGSSTQTGAAVINFTVAANTPVFNTVFWGNISDVGGAGVNAHAYITAFTTTTISVYVASRTTVAAATGTFYYLIIGT